MFLNDKLGSADICVFAKLLLLLLLWLLFNRPLFLESTPGVHVIGKPLASVRLLHSAAHTAG